MEGSLPRHLCHVQKSSAIINRFHALIHSTALIALIYYRASFLLQNNDTRSGHTPIIPWLLVFAGELVLSFIWLLDQAFRWRPVTRAVFPERLPEDKQLPSIDVFICTVDPKKEPTLEVMNTVISAMALDYPPEKLHVYVSDDGGSSLTLYGMKEAWEFARLWVPFCRTHGIKTPCPKAYFSSLEDGDGSEFLGTEFMAERRRVQVSVTVLFSLIHIFGDATVATISVGLLVRSKEDKNPMLLGLSLVCYRAAVKAHWAKNEGACFWSK